MLRQIFIFFLTAAWIGSPLSADMWERYPLPYDQQFSKSFQHSIKSVSEEIVEIEDGSAWNLTQPQQDIWSLDDRWVLKNTGYDWQNGDDVVFFKIGYRLLLLNMKTREAEIITQVTPPNPELSRYITQITRHPYPPGSGISEPISTTIELDDGSQFKVGASYNNQLDQWEVGDLVTVAAGPNYILMPTQ